MGYFFYTKFEILNYFHVPMNLRIKFEKPFMYWLTLQKYYTKFIKLFESKFHRL